MENTDKDQYLTDAERAEILLRYHSDPAFRRLLDAGMREMFPAVAAEVENTGGLSVETLASFGMTGRALADSMLLNEMIKRIVEVDRRVTAGLMAPPPAYYMSDGDWAEVLSLIERASAGDASAARALEEKWHMPPERPD